MDNEDVPEAAHVGLKGVSEFLGIRPDLFLEDGLAVLPEVSLIHLVVVQRVLLIQWCGFKHANLAAP